MKHIQTFESFINEAKDEIIFSVDDEKLDQMLHSRFGKKLDYEDVKGDSYYALPKREFDQFIDLADSSGFDVDYDGSEDSVVYVYESTINEAAIEIVYYSEVIDNFGKTTKSSKADVIAKLLQTPDDWSDDQKFEDKLGKLYFIDDLIGKTVKVGNKTFKVEESIVNEAALYKIEDFPINSLIEFKDGEIWKVVKAGMRASDSRVKSGEITISPNNKLAKDKHISLPIDVNLEYLNANVSKITK